MPEVTLGALPGGGGTQTLPRLVGLGDAFLMLFTGESIAADEALRMRLVQKVVPGDKLLEQAVGIAEKICGNGHTAVRLVKEVALLGLNLPLAEALWLEQIYFQRNRVLSGAEIEQRLRKFQEGSEKKSKGGQES